jgi:hypothetical protein
MQVDVGRRASRVGAKIDFFAEKLPDGVFYRSALDARTFFYYRPQ